MFPLSLKIKGSGDSNVSDPDSVPPGFTNDLCDKFDQLIFCIFIPQNNIPSNNYRSVFQVNFQNDTGTNTAKQKYTSVGFFD